MAPMWPADQAWRAPSGDFPPRWASAWGDDRYGLWADLVVGGVTQRLRWIEPTGPEGYWMGSTDEQVRELQANVPDGYPAKEWAEWVAVEAPRHRVNLSQGFWLADTPCTQALWRAVTGGDRPSYFKDRPDASMRPVEQVSWQDIDQRFMQGLRTLGLPLSVHQACLPTEAEWEYACRAGSDGAYHWGETFDPAQANVSHGTGASDETSAVYRYAPNAWGLYDMHGNVREWCADGSRDYDPTPQTDPRGPEGPEDRRVLRGGSWASLSAIARSAYRRLNRPGLRDRLIGFRLALRSPSPGPEDPAPGGARPRPAAPARSAPQPGGR